MLLAAGPGVGVAITLGRWGTKEPVMRMLLRITFPTDRFNAMLKAGMVGPTIQKILADTQPEAVYFGDETEGQRGAIVVVDVPTPAELPRVSEPWYLAFEARVETSVAMTPEEVAGLDLDGLAKAYT